MKVDFHMHTSFSYDSETAPEEMIRAAIGRGLKTICITDHHDIDFTEPATTDYEAYWPTLKQLQEKYRDQIEILIGMEFGMQSHLGQVCDELAKKYPFDFVIGSIHVVDGYDPYCPEYFQVTEDAEGYRRAFELTLEGLRVTKEIDVLGHLDYIVRYGTKREETYSYAKYADSIDAILRYLIENGKGLEVNTGGWKYGLSFAHPHQDVLKRYRELGGEIITIGSDAHKPEHVAYDFDRLKAYLEACGFAYYTEFRNRTPKFCKI